MAIKTALRKYTSMTAFEAEKAQLPFPSVCYIDDDGEKYVFFRNALSGIDDMLYHLGYEETPSYPDVPGDSGGGEEPENPDTPEEPTGYDFEISGPTEIICKEGNEYDYTTSNTGGSIYVECEWLYISVVKTSSNSFKIRVTQQTENDMSKPVIVTVSCGDVTKTLSLVVKGYKEPVETKKLSITGYPDICGVSDNSYEFKYVMNGISGTPLLTGIPSWITVVEADHLGFRLNVTENRSTDDTFTITATLDGETATMTVVCHKIDITITGTDYIEGKAGNTYNYTVQYSSFGYNVSYIYLNGFEPKVDNLPDGVTATNVSLTGFTLSVASNIAEDVRQTIRYEVDGIAGRLAIDFAHYDIQSGKDFGNFKHYTDLGLPSGTLWASQNIGSELGDAEIPGDYFAWGEMSPKNYFDWVDYGNNDLMSLPKSKDVVNATYGGDWRMPTNEDVNELISNTEISKKTFFGKLAIVLKSKINGMTLVLPCTGYYNGNTLYDPDNAYIWCNGVSQRNSTLKSYAQGSDLLGLVTSYYTGYYGMNVRGVI